MVRAQIELYLRELRGAQPRVNGNSLKSLGLTPGPVYRWVLGQVLEARLDGRATTLEDEKALVRRLLAERGPAEQ